MDLFIALMIFLFSFASILFLRKKIGKEYEIKNADILIGLIPLALWLLLSGKITSFEYGDLKFETAFKEATHKSISSTITSLYKDNIPSAEKGSILHLQSILESKPEALIFYSGQDSYSSDVIREYLQTLSASTLRYLIIKNSNKEFIGMIRVDLFMSQTLSESPTTSPIEFADWLNEGKDQNYSLLKGFITKQESLSDTVKKVAALQRFEELESTFLPVLSKDKFVGILERDRLAASLLMDVSNSLSKN